MGQEHIDLAIAAPGTKIASAWAGVGASMWITTWADVAAVLASIYTLVLLSEWVWKKLLRPFAERRGWIKRNKNRRSYD